jgi:hypothetical protein
MDQAQKESSVVELRLRSSTRFTRDRMVEFSTGHHRHAPECAEEMPAQGGSEAVQLRAKEATAEFIENFER